MKFKVKKKIESKSVFLKSVLKNVSYVSFYFSFCIGMFKNVF